MHTPSLGIGQPMQTCWVLPLGGASAGAVGDRRHEWVKDLSRPTPTSNGLAYSC